VKGRGSIRIERDEDKDYKNTIARIQRRREKEEWMRFTGIVEVYEIRHI